MVDERITEYANLTRLECGPDVCPVGGEGLDALLGQLMTPKADLAEYFSELTMFFIGALSMLQ